jgi:hypothetical protein
MSPPSQKTSFNLQIPLSTLPKNPCQALPEKMGVQKYGSKSTFANVSEKIALGVPVDGLSTIGTGGKKGDGNVQL